LRNCTAVTSGGFAPLQNLEKLERLDLYRTLIETDILRSILHKNPHIRHLNLAGMHERLNMDDIALEIAVSCTKLESIDFWKAQTLTVDGIRALTHCINLKEIDFGWWLV
jgi:F-box/leucine-rich repeat protein 4